MIIKSLIAALRHGRGQRLVARNGIADSGSSWTMVGCLLLTGVLFARAASCGNESRARGDLWQPDVVRAVAFAPDGRLLASGRDSGAVQLWEVESGTLVASLDGHQAAVRSLVFTRDGRQLVSTSGDAEGRWGEVLIWDVAERRLARSLPWQGAIRSAALSPDGRVLVAGGSDGIVHCWDVATWSLRTAYQPHALAVVALCFAPDGQRVISAGADDVIKVWRLDNGSAEASLHAENGGNIFALALAPDGKTLVSGHVSDQCARVWDVPSRQLKCVLKSPLGHPRSTTFSPDGSLLAIADGLWREGGGVSLRPTHALQQRTALAGHGNVVYCVAFSPDSRLLATGSADESVRLWNVATGSTIRIFRLPPQCAG